MLPRTPGFHSVATSPVPSVLTLNTLAPSAVSPGDTKRFVPAGAKRQNSVPAPPKAFGYHASSTEPFGLIRAMLSRAAPLTDKKNPPMTTLPSSCRAIANTKPPEDMRALGRVAGEFCANSPDAVNKQAPRIMMSGKRSRRPEALFGAEIESTAPCLPANSKAGFIQQLHADGPCGEHFYATTGSTGKTSWQLRHH